MLITGYLISIWIIAVIVGSLTFIVFYGSNRLSAKYFATSSSLVTIWIVNAGFLYSTLSPQLNLAIIKLSYSISVIIASSFILFVIVYKTERHPNTKLLISIHVPALAIIVMTLFSELIIKNEHILSTNIGWKFGNLSYIFEIICMDHFFSDIS